MSLVFELHLKWDPDITKYKKYFVTTQVAHYKEWEKRIWARVDYIRLKRSQKYMYYFQRNVVLPLHHCLFSCSGLFSFENVCAVCGYIVSLLHRVVFHTFCYLSRRSSSRLSSTSSQTTVSPPLSLFLLQPGFHMMVPIVPVVSNNVQTIGTIIWKHYPDDRKRPDWVRPRSL